MIIGCINIKYLQNVLRVICSCTKFSENKNPKMLHLLLTSGDYVFNFTEKKWNSLIWMLYCERK
jgi:hypothetical protein